MNRDDISHAIEQAPAFVAISSLDGLLLWASRIAYGLDRETMIGQRGDEIIFPEDRPCWWESFRRAVWLREAVPYCVRCHVPAPPGWLRLQGKLGPIVQNDTVQWVAAITHDITAAKTANPLALFLLAPLCRRIISVLLSNPGLKSNAIARRLDQANAMGQATSSLRVILALLVERHILVLTRSGYDINASFRPFAAEAIQAMT